MKNIFSFVVVGLFVAARAQALPVDNFSFESPTAAPQSNGIYSVLSGTTTDNWIYVSPSGAGVQNIVASSFTSEGTAVGVQTGWINVAPGESGTITSTDSFTIVAGTNYVLTVALGERSDGLPPDLSTISLIDTTEANTVIASNTITAAQLTPGTFTDWSAELTAAQSAVLAGDSMTIQLSETNTTGAFVQGNFDNVRLDASVPEPSTYAMLGLGLAGLIFLARRKLAFVAAQ